MRWVDVRGLGGGGEGEWREGGERKGERGRKKEEEREIERDGLLDGQIEKYGESETM